MIFSDVFLFISDAYEGSSPAELSPETAFRIFHIAHRYGMQLMVEWCVKAFERTQLKVWPSEPIPSSEVLNHSGLVQCLALADSKQCDPLIKACLSQLTKPGDAEETVRKALVSPHLGKLMDDLRPETKDRVLRGLVKLPDDFKVSPPWYVHKILFTAMFSDHGIPCTPSKLISRHLSNLFDHLLYHLHIVVIGDDTVSGSCHTLLNKRDRC